MGDDHLIAVRRQLEQRNTVHSQKLAHPSEALRHLPVNVFWGKLNECARQIEKKTVESHDRENPLVGLHSVLDIMRILLFPRAAFREHLRKRAISFEKTTTAPLWIAGSVVEALKSRSFFRMDE